MIDLSLFTKIRTFTFIVTLYLSVSLTSYAAPTLDDYAMLPETELMTMSPNGDLIAFRKKTNDQDVVLVFSLKEGKTITGFNVAEVNPQRLYFLDDEKIILKASEVKRIRNFKGRIDVSTAFVYNIKTKKLKQLLTPGDKIYTGQSGLGDITAISDDKKYAYMTAFVGSSVSDLNPDFNLMKVKLDSPKKPKIHKRGQPYTIEYFMDSTGKVLAREDYNNNNNKHEIYSYLNKKKKVIFSEKTPIRRKAFVGLTSDLKSLVMLAWSDEKDSNDYFTMSLENGSITKTNWGRDDAEIEYALRDINKIVYGVRYSGFTPSYRFFDDKIQKRIESILELFPDHSVYMSDWNKNWSKVLILVEGSTEPASYYLIEDNSPPKRLGSQYNVESKNIHPIGRTTFKARDGLKIPALLTIPKNKLTSMKNLPAVIFPHGGPEAYDQVRFDGLTQALANEGYLVVQPQFRGSDGFGKNHTLAGRGEWGKKMQDDLSDAVKFLSKRKMINPEKVCIAGISYGGYAALAGGAYTPDLYKCVVSINGISHLKKMLENEKQDHGRRHSVVSYWEEVIAKGDSNKQFLKQISPYYSASSFKAPTLIMHGTRDEVVNIRQSRLMTNALKKASKDVTLIELKNETHYLEKQKTRTQALKEMVSFINKHIGD